jgi:hypothetical protein
MGRRQAGRNRIDDLFSAICVRQHSRSFHVASRLVFIITRVLELSTLCSNSLQSRPPREAYAGEAEEADADSAQVA